MLAMQSAFAENRIFQALADPSRRAIFESLTRGEAAVKDLTARFDISQPAVSQHLAALNEAMRKEPLWPQRAQAELAQAADKLSVTLDES